MHSYEQTLTYVKQGKLSSIEAYDSIITIVDPDFSIFDLKM